jgi:hypothetical protein
MIEPPAQNPYAPPAAEAPPESSLVFTPGDVDACFRDGRFLIVKSGAALPAICPFTGRPAANDWPKQKFGIGWTPPGAYPVVLVYPPFVYAAKHLGNNGIVGGISSSAAITIITWVFVRTRKPGVIQGVISPAIHRANRQMGVLCVVLGLLALSFPIILGVGTFTGMNISDARAKEFLIVAGILLLVILYPFFAIKRLRSTHHHAGWFRVTGCHPKFLDQLPPVAPFT